MTTKKIALFGIFRSGTNYTRTVLEWNFDCELVTNEYGWKHGYFPIITNRSRRDYGELDIIHVSKDPFASIHSLYKYYSTNGRNIIASRDWDEFLRGRFIIYDYFQEGSPQYRFANVVEYWNSMNWNYCSISKNNFKNVNVNYDELLKNPFNTALAIAKCLELKPKFKSEDQFKLPEKTTKNMGDKPRDTDSDYVTDRKFSPEFYRNNSFMERYSSEDIKFVFKNIDMELATKLGYKQQLLNIRKKSRLI